MTNKGEILFEDDKPYLISPICGFFVFVATIIATIAIISLVGYLFGFSVSIELWTNDTVIRCTNSLEATDIGTCIMMGVSPGLIAAFSTLLIFIAVFGTKKCGCCLVIIPAVFAVLLLIWSTWRTVGYFAEKNGMILHTHSNKSGIHDLGEKPCYYNDELGIYSVDCALAGLDFYFIIVLCPIIVIGLIIMLFFHLIVKFLRKKIKVEDVYSGL